MPFSPGAQTVTYLGGDSVSSSCFSTGAQTGTSELLLHVAVSLRTASPRDRTPGLVILELQTGVRYN